MLAFDNASSVLGMDGASSVRLGERRRLFLFGDTFYGSWGPDAARRIAGTLSNSAIRVRDADAARCFAGVQFEGGAQPRPVIVPPARSTPQHRVWPMSGHASGNRLTLFFSYARLDPGQPLGFAVEGSGVAVGSVDPLQVDASAAEIHPAAEPALASALLVQEQEGVAFVYRCAPGAQRGGGYFPCVVARVALDSLADVSAYRYFVAGRGFVGGLGAASVVTEGAPEFTVTFNRHLGRFLMVYIEPFSNQLSARIAAAPEGPFSGKTPLARCALPAAAAHAYCYGGKEHEGLGRDAGRVIAVTYNTNSSDMQELVRSRELYWPRFLLVDLEEKGVAAAAAGR